MTAKGQNFEMWQGDDKVLRVTVVDDADVPVDISGSTIKWVIYKRTGENVVLSKTLASGIALTVPASGIFEITLDRADTLNLLGNSFNHEAELSDASNNRSTIFTGTVAIHRSLANV